MSFDKSKHEKSSSMLIAPVPQIPSRLPVSSKSKRLLNYFEAKNKGLGFSQSRRVEGQKCNQILNDKELRAHDHDGAQNEAEFRKSHKHMPDIEKNTKSNVQDEFLFTNQQDIDGDLEINSHRNPQSKQTRFSFGIHCGLDDEEDDNDEAYVLPQSYLPKIYTDYTPKSQRQGAITRIESSGQSSDPATGCSGDILFHTDDMKTRLGDLARESDGVFINPSSLEHESMMVDQAIDRVMTIPSAVADAAEAEYVQTAEMEKLEAYLMSLQDRLTRETSVNENLKEELEFRIKEFFQQQQIHRSVQKELRETSEEIKTLINSVCEEERKLFTKTEEMNKSQKLIADSRRKIANFQGQVEQVQENLEESQELKKCQQQIAELKQKISLKKVSGLTENDDQPPGELPEDAEKSLKESIDSIRAQIQQEKRRHDDLQQMFNECRDRRNANEQTIVVLKKRNAAHFLRLKRQVNESQGRIKEWHDQISNLNRNIQELHQKLTQST